MPSVEYDYTQLVSEQVEQTYENPETEQTETVTSKQQKNPFEVRISKWLEASSNYKLHGYVEVTPWGQDLHAQSSPHDWITNNYQTASSVDQTVIDEWLQGIQAVKNGELQQILSFANISPVSYNVTGNAENKMEFIIELESKEVFDIDWLHIDFDPNRGDA